MGKILKSKAIKIDILSILALLIVARISCPALSNIPIFSMAFTFMYGAAFIFIYLATVGKFKKNDFYLLMCAALYTVYVAARSFLAGKGLFARDSFNAYIIVFLTMIYIWVKTKPLETKVFFFKLIVFSLIFDYLYSVVVLFFDPNASRTSAALSVLDSSPYDILNAVGGFDAVYGGLSVILIILGMRRVLKDSKTKNKTSLVLLILSLAFIIMTAYGTALLLLIAALVMFGARKNKLLPILFLPIIILFFMFHEAIGQLIIEISSLLSYSQTASEKLRDAGEMLKTFEAAGTYAGETGRAAKMLSSFETFKRNPIFGGMGVSGTLIGGHSEFLDMLGTFGLLAFVLFAAFFVFLYKSVKHELKHKELKASFIIIIIVFVISSILNPSLYALQMMPLILMMPLAPSYIEMCKNKNQMENL